MASRLDLRYVLFGILLVIVFLTVAVLAADLSYILLGPNEASEWTEMDFNRGPPQTSVPFYSREEMKCFDERKLYFMGKCYNIKERGPCPDKHWIVLDGDSQGLKAQCAPKLCPNDSAYWLLTGECILLNTNNKCTKKETSLQVDALGYGACKCLPGAARAMADNGNCYLLYTKGFCDPGFVVALDPEAEEYPAVCVKDICNTTSVHQVLLPYKGFCYPEGSHEACPEGKTLNVDVHSGLPTCSSDLIQWHIIRPPPLCTHGDVDGNCRDKATIKQESDNYKQSLTSDKKKFTFGRSKG